MSLVKVVCLSYDQGIAEQRRVALKRAGFEVVATTLAERARAAVLRERTDVVVIGHHFADVETDPLIDEARKIWSASVVIITGIGAPPDVRADVSVPVLHGLDGLVKAVETAVSRMVAA